MATQISHVVSSNISAAEWEARVKLAGPIRLLRLNLAMINRRLQVGLVFSQ